MDQLLRSAVEIFQKIRHTLSVREMGQNAHKILKKGDFFLYYKREMGFSGFKEVLATIQKSVHLNRIIK